MEYIWIFIGIPAAFFAVVFMNSDVDTAIERFFMVFFGAPIAGTLVGGMIYFLVSGIVVNNLDLEKEEVVMSSYDLVALNQDKQTKGEMSMFFFVGSGYIGETEYYVYYKQFGNGDILFEKVEATDVFLNQRSDTPKVVKYGWRYKDPDTGWLLPEEKEEIHHTKTVLYIPAGTIKRNFKIN